MRPIDLPEIRLVTEGTMSYHVHRYIFFKTAFLFLCLQQLLTSDDRKAGFGTLPPFVRGLEIYFSNARFGTATSYACAMMTF